MKAMDIELLPIVLGVIIFTLMILYAMKIMPEMAKNSGTGTQIVSSLIQAETFCQQKAENACSEITQCSDIPASVMRLNIQISGQPAGTCSEHIGNWKKCFNKKPVQSC